MFGSAKTNLPLLTLTSWVKEASPFAKYLGGGGNCGKLCTTFCMHFYAQKCRCRIAQKNNHPANVCTIFLCKFLHFTKICPKKAKKTMDPIWVSPLKLICISKLDLRTTVLISGRQRKVWHLNMIHNGTESVKGCTGWYLVVLGQYRAVLASTWWYWVSKGRCW